MREPVSISVAIGGVLSTGVALLAVLWPERLSPETQAGVIAFGNAIILAISIIWARANSTPTSAPVLPAGQPVTTPGGESATVALVVPE